MAKVWELFEDECYNYLQEKFFSMEQIEKFGAADSTKADIKICLDKKEFFIEVKSSDAQCGQFVLFPNGDTKKFDFSKHNKVSNTTNSKKIISHMNENFKKYEKPNTKGIEISVSENTLHEWICDVYRAKQVEFFITKGKEFIILPIKKFSNYFSVTACYRKKRSGSSEPNEKNNLSEIKEGLENEKIIGDVKFIKNEKNRCFLFTKIDNIDKVKVYCQNYTYYIVNNKHSKKQSKDDGYYVYEIRRLSNTSNPNVICQLSLIKDTQEQEDLLEFSNYIEDKENL